MNERLNATNLTPPSPATGIAFERLPDGNTLIEFQDDKGRTINTQVIVSTQSSLLLDHFDPEDVLVANRVDGGTQIIRLEPEQLKEWLNDYSLGQLWEKGELTGRPLST